MKKENKFSKEYICRHVWNILINLAKNHKTAFYENVRDNIFENFGIRYSNQYIGSLLSPIQDHCLENDKPPLTALIINKQKKLPGIGFIAADVSIRQQFEQLKQRIFNYNWDLEDSPFQGYDTTNASVDSYAKQIVNHPDTSKEVWRKVKDRGQCQRIFREGLLLAYEYKCAICGFSFGDSLQAAHIKAYANAEPSEKISIKNGLLLCPNHHALYDKHWFWITREYTVDYDPDVELIGIGDNDCLKKFKGKKITLPKNKELWPDKELLKQH